MAINAEQKQALRVAVEKGDQFAIGVIIGQLLNDTSECDKLCAAINRGLNNGIEEAADIIEGYAVPVFLAPSHMEAIKNKAYQCILNELSKL